METSRLSSINKVTKVSAVRREKKPEEIINIVFPIKSKHSAIKRYPGH